MKLITVSAIEIHRIKITINPAKGERHPKKAADHNTFRISWIQKMKIAFLTFCSPASFCHTRYREIPIITKRTVHIGKNTQFGGAKDGLMIPAYHTGIAGVVKNEPRKPADRHIPILTISLTVPDIFLFDII